MEQITKVHVHARGAQHPMEPSKPLLWEYGRDATYPQPGVTDDRSPNLAIRDGRRKLLVNADGSRLELYDFDRSQKERENVAAQYPGEAKRLAKMLLDGRRRRSRSHQMDRSPTAPRGSRAPVSPRQSRSSTCDRALDAGPTIFRSIRWRPG